MVIAVLTSLPCPLVCCHLWNLPLLPAPPASLSNKSHAGPTWYTPAHRSDSPISTSRTQSDGVRLCVIKLQNDVLLDHEEVCFSHT